MASPSRHRRRLPVASKERPRPTLNAIAPFCVGKSGREAGACQGILRCAGGKQQIPRALHMFARDCAWPHHVHSTIAADAFDVVKSRHDEPLRGRDEAEDTEHRSAAVVDLDVAPALFLLLRHGIKWEKAQGVEEVERDWVRDQGATLSRTRCLQGWIEPWLAASHVCSSGGGQHGEGQTQLWGQLGVSSAQSIGVTNWFKTLTRLTVLGDPSLATFADPLEDEDGTEDLKLRGARKGIPLVGRRASGSNIGKHDRLACNALKRPLASQWASSQGPRKDDFVRTENVTDECCHRHAAMLNLCVTKEADRCLVTLTPEVLPSKIERIPDTFIKSRNVLTCGRIFELGHAAHLWRPNARRQRRGQRQSGTRQAEHREWMDDEKRSAVESEL